MTTIPLLADLLSEMWSNEFIHYHEFAFFLTKFCLNDRIEQFHGDQRSINKTPTPQQFKQNAKIISITDYMGHVKTGAYNVSEERGFLTDFNTIQSFLEDD